MPARLNQYYAVDSPVHRLDPRLKLVITVLYMCSCFFVSSPATLVFAGAAIAGAIALARVPFGRLNAAVSPVLFFLLVTSVINLFFVQTGDVLLQAGPVRITVDGASAAVLYTARFYFLLLAGALLMLTTTAIALTDAAEKLLAPLERRGVPVGEGMLVLSIALRFVPTLANDLDTIIAAQTARGADLEGKGALGYAKACVPLIVPLFASSLRHADNLARAMDARCYTGHEGRTHYHVMRLDARRDGTAMAVAALYLAILAGLTLAGL